MKQAFVWGAATAAYQVEGAVAVGGRGASIWDAFSHTPGKVVNGDTGDVACDQFHRYEEDIRLMRELGVDVYRFSFAWPRIMPTGTGPVNAEGLAHYDRVIDCLLANGITPWVTLYHWDLPLALQIEHDGWLSYDTAEAFAAYAAVCFEHFGDRVKNWITLNEPWCSAVLGHGVGVHAPGRRSATEPYLAGHNLLRAHALAVKAFRSGGHDGQIGLSNNCDWREPLSAQPADVAAAQRALEFFYGWFTDPVVFGDYPAVMREMLGARLPVFTPEERALLTGSIDFLGLNHYVTTYAAAPEAPVEGDDQQVAISSDPAWERSDMGWNIVPWGFRKLLEWIAARYPGYPIYVTENGCACAEPDEDAALYDQMRCRYISDFVAEMRRADAPVAGYFVWSLLDNFEWAEGYNKRFGIIRCDYRTLKRTPKGSYQLYRDLIRQAKTAAPR